MPLNVNVDVEYTDAGFNGTVYDGVSELESRSVILHGEVTDLGEANSALCYFEYINVSAGESWASDAKKIPTDPVEINSANSSSAPKAGEFSTTLDGLSPATLYKFRAVAEGQ